MITAVASQLRTTDPAATIHFYTGTLGFTVDFVYEKFYADIRIGNHAIHLKRVDAADPSIAHVEEGGHLHLYFQTTGVAIFAEQLKRKGMAIVRDVHDTPWGTRELVVLDDQGHTRYFGEAL